MWLRKSAHNGPEGDAFLIMAGAPGHAVKRLIIRTSLNNRLEGASTSSLMACTTLFTAPQATADAHAFTSWRMSSSSASQHCVRAGDVIFARSTAQRLSTSRRLPAAAIASSSAASDVPTSIPLALRTTAASLSVSLPAHTNVVDDITRRRCLSQRVKPVCRGGSVRCGAGNRTRTQRRAHAQARWRLHTSRPNLRTFFTSECRTLPNATPQKPPTAAA